jgi:hypothetical protein
MAAYAPMTTRMSRVLLELVALGCLLGLTSSATWTIDVDATRATLRSVQGLSVFVETFGPDMQQGGLSKQQLTTDTELRLRQAGIPVLPQANVPGVPGAAFLYLDLNIIRVGEFPIVAYSVSVSVHQAAFLASDSSSALVATWDVRAVGNAGFQRLSSIRSNVQDLVDQFINAYLSVHPRPAASTPPPASVPQPLRAR